ncbi:MAG: hypothetical protein ACR2IE_05005 [Candidatus Sumerlaeaceae bacterium]
MRRILCIGIAVLSSTAMAAFYNGVGPGFSTIGATGPADYPSLSTALSQIQNGPALTGGDWVLRIRTDLTEPSNLTFGKSNLNGNRLIIKPETAASVTVKFTSSSGRAHLAIGTTSTLTDSSNGFVKTDNVIIDGSNNGTSSQNLTLLKDPLLGQLLPVVQIVGNSDGCQVKNCSIRTVAPSPTGTTVIPAVQFASYYLSSQITDEYPDNGLVENNDILVGAYKFGSGVAATAKNLNAFTELPGAQAGIIVRNNRIVANRSGVELQNSRGAEVSSNTISVEQFDTVSDGYAIGIWHSGAGNTTSTDVNIFNNRILQVHGKRGAFLPVSGMVLGTRASGFSYNIYNNMVADVQITFGQEWVAGIYVAGTSTVAQSANVYNNSVHLSQRASGSAGYTPSCLSIPDSFPARTTNVVAKNNIFCMEETTGVCIYRTAPGSFTSDRNSFYLRLGSDADLTAWRTQSGQDLNSTYANPRVANPPAAGLWTSLSDHHFTAFPGTLFQGLPIAQVTTDIDGQTRNPVAPHKGADEIPAPANVAGWAGY